MVTSIPYPTRWYCQKSIRAELFTHNTSSLLHLHNLTSTLIFTSIWSSKVIQYKLFNSLLSQTSLYFSKRHHVPRSRPSAPSYLCQSNTTAPRQNFDGRNNCPSCKYLEHISVWLLPDLISLSYDSYIIVIFSVSSLFSLSNFTKLHQHLRPYYLLNSLYLQLNYKHTAALPILQLKDDQHVFHRCIYRFANFSSDLHQQKPVSREYWVRR